jgi:hypothetical protein
MRRRPFVATLSVAVIALLSPVALATGPGGWDHLGHGSTTTTSALNSHVDALNSDNPGILYVGGAFTNAGGVANADHLAKWNGTAWSAVNGAVTLNGAVDAIAYASGHVYVGGQFTNVAGNTSINYLAEWTGTAWQSPCAGTNPITAQVAALQIIGNTLYVGGSFANGAGLAAADFLVACDLTTGAAHALVATDGAINSGVAALTADSNGTLYAGGGFINLEGVTGVDHVAYYKGGTWHQMGGPHAVNQIVRSLAAHGADVYVGTDATDINGILRADHIARWNAQSLAYSAMGSNSAGTNGWFTSYAFLYGIVTSGSLVFVGGSFQNANEVATADDFAYFDGSSWHPVGSNGAGNGPLNSYALALGVLNHSVVTGGNFIDAGGDALADHLASHTIQRPDARIGTAAAGPFVGNNIYSASGSGSGEYKSISVQRGHSGTLWADFQNDGLSADTLKVTGPSGANGFSVSYYQGATNVSSQVYAGSFSTSNMTPGAHTTLKVVIKVAAGSVSSITFLISARSQPGVQVDAVTAIVHAT